MRHRNLDVSPESGPWLVSDAMLLEECRMQSPSLKGLLRAESDVHVHVIPVNDWTILTSSVKPPLLFDLAIGVEETVAAQMK